MLQFFGTLRRGSSGTDVMDLQILLADLGYNIEVDGDYGPDTEAAIRLFQSRSGFPVDGVASDEVIEKLREVSKPAPLVYSDPDQPGPAQQAPLEITGNAGSWLVVVGVGAALAWWAFS